MTADDAAPLWIVFLPQLFSVAGDSFGQRCSRVYHKQNRRRFLIAMVAVSSIQMFIVMSIIQLSAPSTTSIIYEKVNNSNVDFCDQPEHVGDDRCFAQGPLTIYKMPYLCPLILLNGLLNLIYYYGEASMYREPLGVLMLVLAALASSFLIAPMQNWFDLEGAKEVSGWAIALGLVGSVLCLMEREPPSQQATTLSSDIEGEEATKQQQAINSSSASLATLTSDASITRTGDHKKSHQDVVDRPAIESRPLLFVASSSSTSVQRQQQQPAADIDDNNHIDTTTNANHLFRSYCRKVKAHLPLVGPFVLLSFAYGLYFVIMLLYNDKCKVNAWGYNSFDQVTLPIYLIGTMWVIDMIGPCRELTAEGGRRGRHRPIYQIIPVAGGDDTTPAAEAVREGNGEGDHIEVDAGDDDEDDPTLWAAFKHTYRELTENRCAGLACMFTYRMLINVRAVAYSFITVMYTLSSSYLQLTLIRVVLSWIATLTLVLLAPSFIQSDVKEQMRLKDVVNLVLKIAGTVAIVGALLIIHFE